MAGRFWPGEDAIGKRFRPGEEGDGEPWLTVVGVVADVRREGLGVPAAPEFYQPHAQVAWPRAMAFVVRSPHDPALLAGALREALRAVDPAVPVTRVAPLRSLVSDSVAAPRFRTALLASFAALAGALALLGIYGVVGHMASQRRWEMGLRLALGATPRRVLAEMAGRGARLVVAGIVLGLAGAAAASRLLRGMLYGVSGTDPATYAAVAAAFAVVALLACMRPARSAARVDPAVTLRAE
jgi:hypothetical protein